ncbi:MAG: OmpA family protein [Spirochaetales bacterium]|nr:OmpA family protein [Spirochaetales bacterium]
MKAIRLLKNTCILVITAIMFFGCLSTLEVTKVESNGTVIPDCYYYNGHTYVFVKKEMYWHEARDKCAAVGGHLVIINDMQENMVCKSKIHNTTWIGLSDEETEGKFVWVDSTPLVFQSWYPGEPNNSSSEQFSGYPQDYAALWEKRDFQWDDKAAFSKNHFICEFDFPVTDADLLFRIRNYLIGNSEKLYIAEVTEKAQTVQKLETAIVAQKIHDVFIQQTAGGVRIQIHDLQFKPDSTELLDAEDGKILKLGKLLAEFSNRNILIVGHTAEWGSAQSCIDLSVKRARVIADYFDSHGFVKQDRIQIKGRGFYEPIGDNSTEEGKKRNRRVEIIILD